MMRTTYTEYGIPVRIFEVRNIREVEINYLDKGLSHKNADIVFPEGIILRYRGKGFSLEDIDTMRKRISELKRKYGSKYIEVFVTENRKTAIFYDWFGKKRKIVL
jgi:hypothetical protein